MPKGKLFEYAILFHPHQTREQKDSGILPKSEIVLQPKTVIAVDDKQVAIIASRDIPEGFLDKLDQVEIIVRPFV